MLWTLLVFALVGLLVGAAARLFYPERQLGHVLSTLVLGLFGALAGGALSWLQWPFEEDRFHAGNLFLASIAALAAIGVSAALGYAQRVSGRRNQAPSI